MQAASPESVFNIFLGPIEEFLAKHSAEIDKKAGSRKFFFSQFVQTLLFGLAISVESLRKLVTELKSNPVAKAHHLPATPLSTLEEAFGRFPAQAFRAMLSAALASVTMMAIPELQALGTILLVDGSLFPLPSNISWATYNGRFNAVKLHLALELNRFMPVEALVTEGSFNEKTFLTNILKPGITYIMDRGYVSFKLFRKITALNASFICRVKENLRYVVVAQQTVNTDLFTACLKNVTDQFVTLKDDSDQKTYRLICFELIGRQYYILTNCVDLNPFLIITLYAYRWQVELMFRFFKHELNGLHLFNTSPNGVAVCFYLMLLTAVLQLKLKQTCAKACQPKTGDVPAKTADNPSIEDCLLRFVDRIGEKLRLFWKVSCHWLIHLKNSLNHVFDWETVQLLGRT